MARGGRTWVGRLATALEHALEAQEVLVPHGAGVLEVLPAAELCELHQHHLDEEAVSYTHLTLPTILLV